MTTSDTKMITNHTLFTHEALDDVDQGRIVDHQSVLAWAESLDTDKPLPMPNRLHVKELDI